MNSMIDVLLEERGASFDGETRLSVLKGIGI